MLILQDPTNEQGRYLLESLTEAFRTATQIRAMFAFASAPGVRLIAEAEEFQRVATSGSVDLIVGTDAVTNLRAVEALADVVRHFPNITVRAFLNPRPQLFHPKFCFTRNPSGGYVIAGSGNLTEGGLLRQWEAYAFDQLSEQEVNEAQAIWDTWTNAHRDSLLRIDDERIRNRVANNHVLARVGDLPTLIPSTPAEDEEEAQLLPDDAAVLITQIPRSGNRWSQANFRVEDYTNFFGARPDEDNRLVVFRHVNANGTMAEYESNRPPVTVVSRNFRFELGAAAGLQYPPDSDGRPIGVFVRMAGRTFFYRLLMPDDAEYDTVLEILERRAIPDSNSTHMVRARLTVEQLREDWPSSPFWRLPDDA